MPLPVLRKIGKAGAIASAILPVALAGLAVPAAAQFQSEGYQFLDAVKKRDGDKVNDMLSKPGSTLVNARDLVSGDTGLHVAVARNDALWVRFLLQKGADANIRNRKGATALQLATALGFTEGVDALVKGGANVNVSDQTGETPLIAAVHARNIGLVRMFLAKGADPDHSDNSGRSARDYVKLMGNSPMVEELDAADAKRKAAGTKRDYGPSF